MTKAAPTSTWLKIRADYAQSKGSLNELADQYGLNRKTVQSRCLRERWALERVEAKTALAQEVKGAIKAKAGSVAEEASRLIARTVTEGHSWLDEIEKAKTLLAEGDIAALSALIRAWQMPVETMRKVVQPDQQQVQVRVGVYNGGGYSRAQPKQAAFGRPREEWGAPLRCCDSQ